MKTFTVYIERKEYFEIEVQAVDSSTAAEIAQLNLSAADNTGAEFSTGYDTEVVQIEEL